MSLKSMARELGISRFPRVSGDEPCSTTSVATGVTFSPRERG